MVDMTQPTMLWQHMVIDTSEQNAYVVLYLYKNETYSFPVFASRPVILIHIRIR